MKYYNLCVGSIIFLILSGCATHGEILSEGVDGTIHSKRTPIELAVCIDRNADSYALGSLRSKIVNTGKEPLEVVILNGATHWAIVHIQTSSEGSDADFYLGGAATLTPKTAINRMTRNCEQEL